MKPLLRPNTLRHARGFTLMELLVVIGIIALLSAITITGYMGASQGMAKKRGASQLASVITQARQRACMSNRRVAVVFSRNNAETQSDSGDYNTYSVCTELGAVYQVGGSYCDFFGDIVTRVRGRRYGGNYRFQTIDISNGKTYDSSCGVSPQETRLEDGSRVLAYRFSNLPSTPNPTVYGDGIMLWMRASQNYSLPGGYRFSGNSPIIFNADGSLAAGSASSVRADFIANTRGELGFSVSIGSDGRVTVQSR